MAINEIDVVEGRRLGKKKPVDKPRLELSRYLTGVVPAHPPIVDHFSRINDWGLYHNDEFGVCGPTFVANSRKLTTGYLAAQEQEPTDQEVFDLYRRSGNPRFDPNKAWNDPTQDDNGVIMQDMLAEVVKNGFAGVNALGFAAVDTKNLDEVRAAIAIFGFLGFGVDLKTAQQEQTNHRLWDYVSGSGEWGGHAILAGRYADSTDDGQDRLAVITWADVVDCTDNFLLNQLDEAWVVIWPEHLQDRTFMEGIDLATFAQDYEQITGRPFPVPISPTPVPPAPAPAPTPPAPTPAPPAPTPPQPDVNTFRIDDPAVVAHIHSASSRKNVSPEQWVTKHFRNYFHVVGLDFDPEEQDG